MQEYRDRWEALEKENLSSDVSNKIERSEYFVQYRDFNEQQDHQEMEKIVDEAINTAIPDEGQENLTEGEKIMTGLKARF